MEERAPLLGVAARQGVQKIEIEVEFPMIAMRVTL
jgi:hypothetical protein